MPVRIQIPRCLTARIAVYPAGPGSTPGVGKIFISFSYIMNGTSRSYIHEIILWKAVFRKTWRISENFPNFLKSWNIPRTLVLAPHPEFSCPLFLTYIGGDPPHPLCGSYFGLVWGTPPPLRYLFLDLYWGKTRTPFVGAHFCTNLMIYHWITININYSRAIIINIIIKYQIIINMQ